jgi:uncharacterized membrane protein YqaE (UPF0057 family)
MLNDNIPLLIKNIYGHSRIIYINKNITIIEFKRALYKYIFKDKPPPDDNNIQIKINNKVLNFYNVCNSMPLYQLFSKYNIDYSSNIIQQIEWNGRLRGGIFMLLINMVIAIFKLLLLIPKMLIWFVEFIIYSIKVLVFTIKLGIDAISVDGIMGLVKFVSQEILLAPLRVGFILIKKFVNSLGNNTIKAIWGADNVDFEEDTNPTNMNNKKCYKTPDGTVPFSVVIATILCPPVGVFMEYGILGWFNILICALLTLMFYFPGLIYALILLYC